MLKRPWVLLLAALAILPWTTLQTVVPFAIWVGPAVLLRYSRTERSTLRAWLLISLVYGLTALIQLRGQFLPVPLIFTLLIALTVALTRSIPYVLDRWLHPRLRSMSRSLVFPVVMTACEWIAIRYGPYGSWGSTAYSQYYDLPLIQMVSITGLAGLTFLVHWLAPVINAIVEDAPRIDLSRKPALAFSTALGVTLAYGGIRLALAGPDRDMVRVATVAPAESEYRAAFANSDLVALARADETTRRNAGIRYAAMGDSLFAASTRAAHLGARIVAWPEYVPVLIEDEPAMVSRARETARTENIYLMITALIVRKTDSFPYLENIATLLDPRGEVKWRYAKAYPVVGMETALYAGTKGPVPVVTTPYGRLTVAICQDLDFPWFIRRSAVQKASLLIGPADDWPQIRETHAQMEVFRAIENGFSLLRPVNNGTSEAVDPYGRIRAVSGSSDGGEAPMIATLPTHRVFTLYSKMGDWFAWCCVAGMIWFIALLGPPAGLLERKES